MSWNRVTLSSARCALRPHYVPKHTAKMTSVSTPSSASVQEALKRMSLLRDKRLHSKSGEERDCRSRGTEASKEEGSSTTQRSCTTSCTILERHPVRRSARELQCAEKIWTPPSLQSFPITRRLKNLSGRMARKLHRSASLVKAGLLTKNQTVLDAAVVF